MEKKQIDALKILKPDPQQLTIKDEIPEDQLNMELKTKLRKLKEQKNW